MKLEEYLEALRNCPDEIVKFRDNPTSERNLQLLTTELGVYDNYPIFLNTDFNKVVEHLKKSNYRFVKKNTHDNYKFFYKPGTVELQVLNFFPSGLATYNFDEEMKKNNERQNKDFNMGIVLHPYQEKKIKDVSQERAIALVIDDIGRYAQKKGIALCFPNSIGWNYPKDYSKIVYYKP